jgi:hypothetical protein
VAVVAPMDIHSIGSVRGPLLNIKHAATFCLRIGRLLARVAVQITFFVPIVSESSKLS